MQLKKSLGQHFLKDMNIARKITNAFFELQPKNILEIGPGAGALTAFILEKNTIVDHYKAIEIDKEKIEILAKNYPMYQSRFVLGDILKMPVPFVDSFSVIGNFPYNISSPIMFRILAWRDSIHTVIGMFQKEVALRYKASPGSKTYGILSVLLQAFFIIEPFLEVAPGCFMPPPKVQSSVLIFKNNGNPYAIDDFPAFVWLVKKAFSSRRKQLKNNLNGILDTSFPNPNLLTKRAEELSVQDFVNLLPYMKNRKNG